MPQLLIVASTKPASARRLKLACFLRGLCSCVAAARCRRLEDVAITTYTTNILVEKQTVIDAILAAYSAVPGAALWLTPKLGLFVGPTVPSSADVYATYTEPTFHGYAKVAIVLVGPVNVDVDVQGMVFSATFLATAGGPIADTVTGYWVSDGAANFYAAEKMAAPVPFALPGDALTINFILPKATRQQTAG